MTLRSTDGTAVMTRRQAIHATGKALAGAVGLAALPPLAGAASAAQLPQIMQPATIWVPRKN